MPCMPEYNNGETEEQEEGNSERERGGARLGGTNNQL